MVFNDYHFITTWRVQSTSQEVAEILGNAPDHVRWWPSVYIEVEVLEPGNEKGIGRLVSLYTKGWLPYTLRWQFRVSQSNPPYDFRIEAIGDFVGYGIWTFEQDGEWVNIKYEWRISAQKPLLKLLSPLMKPVFSANHHWAMRKGEESLKLELARRHAKTNEERDRIPAPPSPTFMSRR